MVIDAPHANGNSGGAVAAPIFRRIAEATLRYLGVPPTINPAPPVLVARNDPARVELAAIGTTAPVVTLVVQCRSPGRCPICAA